MAEEFKCAVCKKTFTTAWSEEEAVQDLKENFGEIFEPKDCDVVCDDCFKGMFST